MERNTFIIMFITAHQPNYLPYPGFFEKISKSDIFVIVDNVQFVKRGSFGWQHRNKIKTKQGVKWLTIPVLTKNNYFQKINEVKINNDICWQKKHWKSIEINYSKAPFFKKYAFLFENIYNQKWGKLADLNIAIIKLILEILNIKTEIKTASDYNISGKGTNLIINICRQFNIENYISGRHGKDYLDLNKTKKSGINIIFQDFKLSEYKQLYNGFVPNLSIIDLLFNSGAEETIKLLI